MSLPSKRVLGELDITSLGTFASKQASSAIELTESELKVILKLFYTFITLYNINLYNIICIKYMGYVAPAPRSGSRPRSRPLGA